MQNRRVVITGLGVVAPNGADTETFWTNTKEGRSGIDRIASFDVTGLPCQIAGEVTDFAPAYAFRDPKALKRTDRFAQFAMAGAYQALKHAGIDLETVNRDRFGVIIGTGIGGLGTMEKAARVLVEKGPGRVSPMSIIGMMGNAGSALVALEYDLRGPNMSIVTACATGSNSAGEAYNLIKAGKADLFLAGGCEATVTPLGVASFSAMRAMSEHNDDPAGASRPFDRGRDGFVMGEGSGIVLLEELEHAKKRGANILCEMTGYGCTADAYHMTSPRDDGQGVARAIRLALEEAGLVAADVDYLNAHATSTPIGDACEATALQIALGEQAKSIPISSTKSMTGHLLGAAGSVELAICALAIRDGVIPPTINLDDPDPECGEFDFVPHTAREKTLRVVLNNSFGFGGHNTTIVVRKFE